MEGDRELQPSQFEGVEPAVYLVRSHRRHDLFKLVGFLCRIVSGASSAKAVKFLVVVVFRFFREYFIVAVEGAYTRE